MTLSMLRGSDGNGHSRPFIYLDHNATTPISERVLSRLPEWAEHWGNPSSIHQASRGPKLIMRESREKIARLLGVQPLELIFTSGGSEANNLALKGVFEHFQASKVFDSKNHVRKRYLISAVEHPSVKRAAGFLRSRGAVVETIPVRRDGSIDLIAYEQLLKEDTAMVSVMLANNETGNIFPIKHMAELAHANGAIFHTDAVQALGKIPVNLRDLGVDLASFSGHKFYTLKGVGVLYARRGVALESLIHGGGQERHRRGGTENVLAIASLGSMAEQAGEIVPRALRMAELRDRLEDSLIAGISGLQLTGAESPRLPNTSSMVIPGVDGETLLMSLDMRGFAVSTGAACSSGSPEPSPVLLAMGLSRDEAQASLRVGLGWDTTENDIDSFIVNLKEVVAHLRSIRAKALEDDAGEKDS